MAREPFRMPISHLPQLSPESLSDLAVQFEPPRLQQRLVCGVLDQRMLERVRGVRREPARVNQFRLGQLRQRGLQILFCQWMHRVYKFVGKLAPYYRCDL